MNSTEQKHFLTKDLTLNIITCNNRDIFLLEDSHHCIFSYICQLTNKNFIGDAGLILSLHDRGIRWRLRVIGRLLIYLSGFLSPVSSIVVHCSPISSARTPQGPFILCLSALDHSKDPCDAGAETCHAFAMKSSPLLSQGSSRVANASNP